MAKLTKAGERAGYLLFLVAIVAFVVGFVQGFTTPIVTIVTVSLLVGSVVLAPSIVFGYGVRAAEKEDRAAGR